MSRISRKDLNGKLFHVMVQGINKEPIFYSNNCKDTYKSIIKSKLQDSHVTVLSYCIMDNHTHFLFYTDSIDFLSKFMQKINTTYSNYYNNVHKRVGYVFRDRYKSQIILDQKHLYSCINYIHNNPVKAGIVSSMEKYNYSSYNEFLGKKSLIDIHSIKIIFNNNTNYLNLFNQIKNISTQDSFIDVKDKNINDFIKETEKEYNTNILELKNNKELLRNFIKKSRIKTDVTLRELADILNISKSTIERFCK